MTLIIAKNNFLYSDCRALKDGFVINDNYDKLFSFRTKVDWLKGAVGGYSGPSNYMQMAWRWLELGGQPKDKPEGLDNADWTILFLFNSADGCVCSIFKDGKFERQYIWNKGEKDKYLATGMSLETAMCLLDMGVSVKKIYGIISKRDVSVGGLIAEISVDG